VIKRIIIFLLLLFSGFLAGLTTYRDLGFLTVEYPLRGNEIDWVRDEPLVKGGWTVRGQFTARDNHLGMVALRVRTFNRINNDLIVFRLRESGQKNWPVFNTYFTDRFIDNWLFPFGFPPIADSINRKYEFEISSVNGVPDNGIGFSFWPPQAVSRYVYTWDRLKTNADELRGFIGKKILNLVDIPSVFFHYLVYLFPAFAYFLTAFRKKPVWQITRQVKLTIITVFIFFGIFLPPPGGILTVEVMALFSAWLFFGTKTLPSGLFAAATALTLAVPLPIFFREIALANRLAASAASLVFLALVATGLREISLKKKGK
jgi:hypothetical protein